MHGSIPTINLFLSKIEPLISKNHRYTTNLLKLNAWKKNHKRRCFSMAGSAFTLISAFLECVTRRPTFAKVESRENLAPIILSVTRHLLVGLHLFGHMRLSAFQWLMLDLYAKLSSIASQGISAGNYKKMTMVNALRNTLLQMVSNSYGTWILTQM